MRVKLARNYAGPGGNFDAGAVHDFSAKEGAALIEAKAGVEVDADGVPVPVKGGKLGSGEELETEEKGAPENAASRSHKAQPRK